MTDKLIRVIDVNTGKETTRKPNASDVFENQDPPQYIIKRIDRYPSIGDALDAIVKQMNQDRLGGKNLIQEMDDWVNACLKVKSDIKKD
jgi:hypothetical protein